MTIHSWRDMLMDLEISSKAKLIGFCLAQYYNPKGKTYPSLPTLENVSGFSRNTVLRAIRELEDVGIIRREKKIVRGNSFKSCLYSFIGATGEHMNEHMNEQVIEQSIEQSIDGSFIGATGEHEEAKKIKKIKKINKKKIAKAIKEKKLSLDERIKKFSEELNSKIISLEYPPELISDFFYYWSEHNPDGKKMKFEMLQTWDLNRRLQTWNRRGNYIKAWVEMDERKKKAEETEKEKYKNEKLREHYENKITTGNREGGIFGLDGKEIL